MVAPSPDSLRDGACSEDSVPRRLAVATVKGIEVFVSSEIF